MTQAQHSEVSISMLKLYHDRITPYDGNPSTRNQFLSNCDFIINNYQRATENILQNSLFKVIQCKLIGHATDATIFVGRKAELNIWPLVKAALHKCFREKKSLNNTMK